MVDDERAIFDVTDAMVRALLVEQHPDLAALGLERLDEGWDNVIFRLGPDLAVRLPRRGMGARLIESEQRWLGELVRGLPGDLATPVPVRVGGPGMGYPWRWSITPWLPGEVLARSTIIDPVDAGERLGAFLAAFHRPAPDDAPPNPYRGIPLAGRAEKLDQGLTAMAGSWSARCIDRIRGRFGEVVAAPVWAGPPLWIHGDLHPLNLLVDRGRLSAVLDFGDLTAGDPATDVAVAWMSLPAGARAAFRDAVGADDATWARAEGWAIAMALTYITDAGSTLVAVGLRMLDQLGLAP